MLTGDKLGQAIRAAIKMKGVTQTSVAAHFGVKPPSVQDWINRGVIAKDKLPELWRYFSDVVGPEHWGLKAWPDLGVMEVPPPSANWPFPAIPEDQVRALAPTQLAALQGALALAIAQLNLGIKVAPLAAATAPTRKGLDVHDADEPFPPYRRGEQPPWNGGKTTLQSEREELQIISAGSKVVANVAAGERHAANDKFERVPELSDVRLAAGHGIENDSELVTGVIQFRQSFLRSVGADGNRGRVMYAKGDSMEPIIQDGAALLVVPDEGLSLRDLVPGAVYAINYDGKMIVKALVKERLTGRWMARSLNVRYGDIPLEGDDASVKILGRVVWAGSKLLGNNGEQWVLRR